MNFQPEGDRVNYGITSFDSTPSAKVHEQYEPSSYGLLRLQQENQKIRQEIKAQFLAEEVGKFHKSMTKAYKMTARREARLDLEEQNRQELIKLKTKLKAEMLGEQNKLMETYREQLRIKNARIEELEAISDAEKDEKIKELEARLEASENDKKVKELEAIVAAMATELDGLRNGGDA